MFAKKYMLFFIFAVLLMGCAGVKSLKNPQRRLSAQDYVKAGHLALQEGDWEQAAFSFNRAIQTDANYAPAYSGAALVLATREQPDKAVEYAEKAVKLDARSFETQFYRGRVLLIAQPENWFDRAIASFDAALKIKSMNEEALYYKAEAYRMHGDYREAKMMYAQVYEIGGAFSRQANEHIIYLDAYVAASPRTQVGADLLIVDAITRADLAALLATELDIVQVMHRRNPNYSGGNNQQWKDEENKRISLANSISDIAGNWAESWIRDVVQVGAMDPYPDNSFRPLQTVQRMDMALTLQNLIIQITGNTSLYTAFINSAPRFSDVPRSHYAYNAVCLVTEYNIMPVGAGDQFDLDGAVSGLQALLSLRNLEHYLDSSF